MRHRRRRSSLSSRVLLASLLAWEQAAAEEPPANGEEIVATAAEPEASASQPRHSAYRWGGIGLPLVGYTGTDGVGFGVGGEVFTRRRGADFGYRDKLTVSAYVNVRGTYTSNFVQYERRQRHLFFTRLIYRLWSDMIHVGSGGADVTVRWPEQVSLGNRLTGPSALAAGQFQIPSFPGRVWVQAYGRYSQVDPNPDGILGRERPYGVDGGWYVDTAVGVMFHEVDRWPLPHKGVQAQASMRGGFTTTRSARPGATSPALNGIVGVNLEAIGWWPLIGNRLVIGGRFLFDKTWGERPFYEQEWLGGWFRDEVSYEQMLLGYSRTATRGDGVLATMIDLRAFLGRTRHPVVDLGFYLDAFAESAFVFEGDDLGPHVPTIGFGPGLLWQGATYLRPWVGFGWLSDTPGGTRRAVPQFGLALVEPL